MSNLSKPTALQRVWEPLTIGNTQVKNRILMTAMGVFYGEDNLLSDRHINYYEERARGGVGLIITEQQAGHKLSKGSFYDGCTAWEERVIPQYAKLADAVHNHEGRIFAQLFAAGVHDKGNMIFDEWHPLWGVSDIPSIFHKEVPHIVDKSDIKDLQRGFAKSAKNVKIAGLDGAELHAAHSYMLGQFLSPTYNNRKDEYGGTNAKRCRFILETAETIRETVGSDFTLGVRLSVEEHLGSAGTTAEQGEEQVEIFSRSGFFDFINISAGGYHTFAAAVPPMGSPSKINLPLGAVAKRVVGNKAKVFLAGRVTNLNEAEEILTENAADMVALTRANFADPHLVNKTKEGRETEIRRCIGANECISRIFDQRPAACLVNPSTGRERTSFWTHTKTEPILNSNRKSIVVVGGGIGGLHFAATASERGHKIKVYEKTSQIGGHILNYACLDGKERWLHLIEDVHNRCLKNGVEIKCNVKLDEEKILDIDLDTLIIATGAKWRKDGRTPYRPGSESIPGHNQNNVYDIETALSLILEDKNSIGKSIVMVDESGGYLALAVAKILLENKTEVFMVTPEPRVGNEAYKTLELMKIMPELESLGVNIYTETNIESIEKNNILLRSIWGTKTNTIENIDSVIFSTFRESNNSLFYSKKLNDIDRKLIGDAMAPRRPAQVIYEAEKLGRNI